jgi:hypothetical protein
MITKSTSDTSLALAVDPTTKGFAFVVLEEGVLIDWGVRHAGSEKNRGSIRKLNILIADYKPDVLVMEDVHDRSSRRLRRIRLLIGQFAREARRHQVMVRRVTRTAVHLHFRTNSWQVTKHRIALALAERFPELRGRLPRVRKLWMTEDERMSIFDALAMALVATKPNGELRNATSVQTA